MKKQSGVIYGEESNFTQVSNSILRNKNISLKAKGLYSLIKSYLTMPNWTLYKTWLMSNTCLESKTAFNGAWKELIELGYLIQYKEKDEKGLYYYYYRLLNNPKLEPKNPHTDFGGVDNRSGGECTTNNTDNNNNNNNNNTNNTTTTDEPQKDVVVDNLTTKITSTLKANIKLSTVTKLIEEVGIERVEYYIDNWDRFKYTQKTNVVGFFIKAIINEYDLPIEQEKSVKNDSVEQVNNFKQREYDEDEFEQYYSNK